MRKNIILFFLLLLLQLSCKEKDNETISITIDITKAQEISKFEHSFQTISIDTSKLALQGVVYSIMFLNDNIAIHTPNRLSLFDSSGIYFRDIGRLGMAYNEYLQLSSVFYENNVFNLFDSDVQRILKFNVNGDFIESKTFDQNNEYGAHKITTFFDNYIALIKYRSRFVETPTLGLFDKSLTLKETMGNIRTSGLSLHHVFSRYQSEMLFWNMFDYNIYSLNRDFETKSKYYINFGKHSIPKSVCSNDRDGNKTMEYFQKNITDVIVSVQYVIEQDSYLSFTFSMDKSCFLAIFDKMTGKTKVYDLKLSEDFTFYPFVSMYKDNYVFCGIDMLNPSSNLEIIMIKQDVL